jgi:hypothetical protein
MKINIYLENQIKASTNKAQAVKELAKRFKCGESTIISYRNGTRYPARSRWKTIVKATDGQVTLVDLAS